MNNLDKIFKAYDVRGIYPEEINEDVACRIGKATVDFLLSKIPAESFKLKTKRAINLVVGRDNRLSSESLAQELIKGIRDQGANVIDIGLSTTPMFYFSVVGLNGDGGIMVTSSHNPKEFNGFKIVGREAMPIGGDSGLSEIKNKTKENVFIKPEKRGILKTKEMINNYIVSVLEFSHIGKIRPCKIVVDTSNGVAGIVIPKLLPKISEYFVGGQLGLIHICGKLDGSFPNHEPDTSRPENLRQLQEKVLSEKADLGIIFDGDADRILFVDEKAEIIDPDFIGALLVHHFFKSNGKIIFTPVASRILKEEIEDSGSIPLCSRVGHTFIREKMRSEEASLGIESSGHYYLRNNYCLDSPLVIFLMVIEIMSKTRTPLSVLIDYYKKYCQEEMNIHIKNIESLAPSTIQPIFEKLVSYFSENLSDQSIKPSICRIDGLKIIFSDWWFNLRASNTEPILRLTIEAVNKELLEEKKQELLFLLFHS